MNNRVALGLAVGAGYVLGRTKKAKLAFAVGTMVAGRRMSASPGALGQLLTRQLGDNPQFKALREQLRQDLGGVGKAATGALVSRQLEGLADRLHERTAGVQDRVKNAIAPSDADAEDDSRDARKPAKKADDTENPESSESSGNTESTASADETDGSEESERPARRTAKKPATRAQPARKTAARKAAKAPAKRVARKAAPKEGRNRG